MDLDDLQSLPHKRSSDRVGASQRDLLRAEPAEIDGAAEIPRRTDRAGATTAALRRNGVAAARPTPRGGQAHPVRGRAGRAARPSITAPIPVSPRPIPWQRLRRPAPAWVRQGKVGYVLGNCQGPNDEGRPGPFPTRISDEIGRRSYRRGKGIRRQYRAQAALRLVRRGIACAGPCGPAGSTGWR